MHYRVHQFIENQQRWLYRRRRRMVFISFEKYFEQSFLNPTLITGDEMTTPTRHLMFH